jgi:hypothetical protein
MPAEEEDLCSLTVGWFLSLGTTGSLARRRHALAHANRRLMVSATRRRSKLLRNSRENGPKLVGKRAVSTIATRSPNLEQIRNVSVGCHETNTLRNGHTAFVRRRWSF